ncbi:MAG: hypothetical protein DI598_15900, partial [Pseudopedobacter saltans]
NTTKPLRLDLEKLIVSLSHFSKNILQQSKTELSHIERQIALANPENLLKRGFSITKVNGKIVKSIHELSPNTEIVTQLMDGNVHSTILNIKENE